MKIPDYEFHEVSALFPLMDSDALARLKDDINENGQLVKVWLYHRKIIDGRNRYLACKELGRPVETQEYEGPEDGLIAFVVGLNLNRRHLDTSQRVAVAVKARKMFDAEAKKRHDEQAKRNFSKDPTRANLPASEEYRARDKAAELLNVSPRSVESGSKVEREGVPELFNAFARGEVAVSAAAEVAELPKHQQEAIVAGGSKEIVRVAKFMREEKQAERAEARRVAPQGKAKPLPEQWSIVGDDAFKSKFRMVLHEFKLAGGIVAYAKDMNQQQRAAVVKTLRKLIKDVESWIEQLESVNA